MQLILQWFKKCHPYWIVLIFVLLKAFSNIMNYEISTKIEMVFGLIFGLIILLKALATYLIENKHILI